MKFLFVLRHAKSSWTDATLSDRDRPLNKRGLRDAPLMGQRWAKQWSKNGAAPSQIVSSPALRALSTAQYMAQALGMPIDAPVVEDRIYEASSDRLVEVIQTFEDVHDRVMLVGHNPGLTDLLNRLPQVRIDNVPTCGLGIVQFEADAWATCNLTAGTLLTFAYPKLYQ